MKSLSKLQAFLQEAKQLLRLGLPIFTAQIALTGLGVVDTIMSGWVGVQDLAAIGLGSSILLPVFIFATGLLLATTPIVARFLGQNNQASINQTLKQGLWLAVPVGILCWALLSYPYPLLDLLNLEPKVYQLTADYLFWASLGLPAIALYQVFRFFWEGLGTTIPTLYISISALLLNIPLNAIFIFGFGPIEAMGAVGSGVATAIVMWLMLLAGWAYVRFAKTTQNFTQAGFVLPQWSAILPILKLGFPMAMSLLFEVGMFTFIVFFIAVLGTNIIGAHQIAISFTSLLFMLPMSLAMALTIRVGHAYGRENLPDLMLSVKTGAILAVVFGSLLSLASIFLREPIVQLYTTHPEVTAIAVVLFLFAASYQVFDSVQVAMAGALRGLHDTQVTMWVTLVCYWILGLGGGYLLAFANPFGEPLGIYGFWTGIVAGLGLAAVLLVWRFILMLNRQKMLLN